RRAVEHHRVGPALLDRGAQRRALAEQVRLADELLQAPRPHARRERATPVLRRVRRACSSARALPLRALGGVAPLLATLRRRRPAFARPRRRPAQTACPCLEYRARRGRRPVTSAPAPLTFRFAGGLPRKGCRTFSPCACRGGHPTFA